MEQIAEIQTWEEFKGGIQISPKNTDLILRIITNKHPDTINENLEAEVNKYWDDISKHKTLTNNPVLYLRTPSSSYSDIVDTTSVRTIGADIRGFKYTQAFNRNKDWHTRTAELDKYKLLTLSTHAHILTKDNKLIFATKKNQQNQISGFSGFPNSTEDVMDYDQFGILNHWQIIRNRVLPELGFIPEITALTALGITYVDTPGLRGTDINYLIKLEDTAQNVEKHFKESAQFKQELFQVEFNSKNIEEFIIEQTQKKRQISKYALGNLILETKLKLGMEECDCITKAMNSQGILYSNTNQSNYLHKKIANNKEDFKGLAEQIHRDYKLKTDIETIESIIILSYQQEDTIFGDEAAHMRNNLNHTYEKIKNNETDLIHAILFQ